MNDIEATAVYLPRFIIIKLKGKMDTTPHDATVNGQRRTYYLYVFNSALVHNRPPNTYLQEATLPTMHDVLVLDESSNRLKPTNPPRYHQDYFKLFQYVVYAACIKGIGVNQKVYFARCALYNTETKSHDYILMRILSTCCDDPHRLWYVYVIKINAFEIKEGKRLRVSILVN